MNKVISRRQGDPKWGSVKIGQTGVTIASQGCVITALSDILFWYGEDKTPDVLAKLLSYTPTGKLYWQSITEKTSAEFLYRYYNFDANTKQVVAEALKHPTKCVMLEFPYAGARHWVWATGKTIFGNYKIADPLKGDFATSSRYGSPIGCAVIDKK